MDQEKFHADLQAIHRQSGLAGVRRCVARGDYLGQAMALALAYIAEQEQLQEQLQARAKIALQASKHRAPEPPKADRPSAHAPPSHNTRAAATSTPSATSPAPLPSHTAKAPRTSAQVAKQALWVSCLALIVAAMALLISLYQAWRSP